MGEFTEQDVPLPTSLGNVVGKRFMPVGDCLGTCLAMHGMSPASLSTWDATARKLAEAGYCVYRPDLFSNDATKPGVLSEDECAELILEALMALQVVGGWAALFGKSWGGTCVSKFVAKYPTAVSRLVLHAPATSDTELMASLPQEVPVLVGWYTDDETVPYSNTELWRKHAKGLSVVMDFPTGGHGDPAPEFSDASVQFMTVQ